MELQQTITIADLDLNINSDESSDRYANLNTLVESITSIGLIQPVVINRLPDGRNQVAAGRRRVKALQALGFTELYEGATCDPAKPGFVYRENMREDEILEVELEENLQRKGFSWTEEVLMISKVHASKVRNAGMEGKSWGYRQTGQLMGVSLGHINNVLTVSALIRGKDDEVIKAGSLSGAIQVLMGRKETEAQKLIAQKSGLTLSNGAPPPSLTSGPDILGDLMALPSTPSEQGTPSAVPLPNLKLSIKLSNHLFNGDSINDLLPRWPDSCVDHIVTDIPYGIDMDNLSTMKDIERVRDEHDVEQNVGLMPGFLHQAFRVLRDGGFCVFFYDLDHHEKLQTWALEEGFKVQRWPLVWVKTHRCKNEAAAFNYTKATEVAMVLRKGNATLTKPQGVNYVMADGSVERKLYDNPFAKPFAVWKFIFEAIAIQGQSVLDPFAGEMSSVRAAILHGLTPYAIELKDTHYNRGIEQVKDAYRLLTTGNVEFI